MECTSFSVGDPVSYLGTIWINYHKKHQAMVVVGSLLLSVILIWS